MSDRRFDIIIVGGGIVGLTIARELVRRGVHDVVILEKEPSLGVHASGRNSGVLHAGIYYVADSLKARFCARGARLMREYATLRSIPWRPCGKVIVATTSEQLPQLDALEQRARSNGIRVERVSSSRLAEIEPAARTVDFALHSPDTATIDSKAVLEALREDLTAAGVTFRFSTRAIRIDAGARTIQTDGGKIQYGHLINAGGLHADTLAHQCGAGSDYVLLPFRGAYQKLRPEAAARIRGMIYPVPDPALPFLGVHLTRTMTDDVLVGPTAMPAFGRENYQGLKGIAWAELPSLAARLARMVIGNRDHLLSHVGQEISKQFPHGLYKTARALMPSLQPGDLISNAKVGLRAQLMDLRTMKLVMDFVIEQGPHSTHVLNAVSPGFTASMAFAETVVDYALCGQAPKAAAHG
jgi:(S)-2-hydroxyglutarate dehydrogenase